MQGIRSTGVICGICGDVFRDLKWIQPTLVKGEGDSVAFHERACLCGSVPISVEVVPAEVMRVIEIEYDIHLAFVEGVFPDPYGE